MVRRLLIASAAILVAPAYAGAEETSADPSVKLVTSSGGYRALANTWKLRRSALEDGDNEHADDLLKRVLRLRRDTGIRRLDSFGIALLREADVALKKDDAGLALRRVRQAEEAAPGLPEVWDARADIDRSQQPVSVHVWLPHIVNAYKARLGDFQRRMLLLSDAALTSLGLLALLGCVFLVAQVIRYGLNVYHDLGQVFPTMAKWVILVGGVLLALFPLIFGFGPLLLVLPIAGLLWAYQSAGERVITATLVLALGATPWLLRMADRLSEAGTGLEQAIHTLNLNPYDHRATATVEATVARNAEDWEARASLGLAYKRLGRLDEARTLLASSARHLSKAASAVTYNNLGNVEFAAGHPKPAEEAYKRARELAPDAPEPVFNLHRLYTRTGNEEAAKDHVQQATALAAEQVTAWSEDNTRHLNRYVVDMDLPADVLTGRALSNVWAPTRFANRAWVVLAGPVPEMAAPLGAAALVVVFLGTLGLRKRLCLTWPCTRCGRSAEVYVIDGPPENPMCEQCVNLFVKNIPVDRRIRFEKELAVERYQSLVRWGTRLSALVLPGFAVLIRGRVLTGTVVAGVAIYIAIRLMLPDGVLFSPVMPPRPASLGFYTLAGVLALLWIYGAWRAYQWTRE